MNCRACAPGHNGQLSGMHVRLEERDVKKVRGKRITQQSLIAWALDICLQVPEGR